MVETVVALAIFGVIVVILAGLNMQMTRALRTFPFNYMQHPSVAAVIARVRRDVSDTVDYPAEFQGWEQTPRTLVLDTVDENGHAYTVVYDFRRDGEAHRRVFVGPQEVNHWIAHAVPAFRVESPTVGDEVAVELKAVDNKGQLAIDQIFVPRPHS
jgi:type II secretory pathway component PulJ